MLESTSVSLSLASRRRSSSRRRSWIERARTGSLSLSGEPLIVPPSLESDGPGFQGLQELTNPFPGVLVGQASGGVELVGGPADVDLRLAQWMHVVEYERLPEVMLAQHG